MNKALLSSDKDNWCTPQDLFNELDREFGFVLDAAADDKNHKCAKYYTKEQDGLKQSRDNEIVYCNPPYGRELKKWVKKWSEIKKGITVMLLPARTDTSRFHDYIYNKAEIRFVKWRLKFWWSKNSAPFPSMVVIFRNAN